MIIINENKTKSISKLNRFQCYVSSLFSIFFIEKFSPTRFSPEFFLDFEFLSICFVRCG